MGIRREKFFETADHVQLRSAVFADIASEVLRAMQSVDVSDAREQAKVALGNQLGRMGGRLMAFFSTDLLPALMLSREYFLLSAAVCIAFLALSSRVAAHCCPEGLSSPRTAGLSVGVAGPLHLLASVEHDMMASVAKS